MGRATTSTNLGGADRLRRAFRDVVRKSGVLHPERTACGIMLSPSHAHALVILMREEARPVSPGALGRELGLDKSSATRLCQRMEASGHVARARDPENGRLLRLELTARGARAAATVERASGDRHAALWDALPKAKRAAVVAALETLAAALGRVAPGDVK